MNRLSVAVLLCCGFAITAGCIGDLGFGTSSESDPEPSVTVPETISDGEDVRQALEATGGDLESLEGVRVKRRPLPGKETEEVTTTFAAEIGTGYEATIVTNESIRIGSPEIDTEHQISNPSETWYYFPQIETAVEIEGGTEVPRELVIRSWLEDADLVYHGTETIAGHRTHHVSVRSFETDAVSDSFEQADAVDVWLDDEYFYPVKHRHVLNRGSDDERVETVTHTDLEFDAEIDSNRFTFDPPEHVTRQDRSGLSYDMDTARQSFDDPAAAEEAVPFEIAVPASVPAGYERDTVTVSDPELRTTAAVKYEGPDYGRLTVRTQLTRPGIPDDAERMAFDDRDAFVYDEGFRDKRTIAWTCDRLWYAVSGDLSVDELRSIVTATPCR